MALDPSTNATMAGKITPADASYPYASAKDETAPGNNDGTPYFKGRADDIFGFFQSLLAKAGVVPNGSADSVTNPQYLESLEKLFDRTNLVLVTADQVYNPPAGVKAIEWQVVGAGGGGGGSNTTSAAPFGDYTGSSGGGGGGYCFLKDGFIDAAYTIVIGQGGAGGPFGDNDGSAGGDTTVTSANVALVGNGGGGGRAYGLQSDEGSAAGAYGGDASGGDINAPGGGTTDFEVIAPNNRVSTSVGGGSFFGGSLRAQDSDSGSGFNATAPGGGGSGLFGAPGGGGAGAQNGGDGANGIVIIKEFYGQN